MQADTAAHREENLKSAARRCLACGAEFRSRGPGNRICGDCQRRNDYAPLPPNRVGGAPVHWPK